MTPDPAPGSRPAAPLLVLFLTVFIHLVGFGIIIPLLPYYALHYGASGLAVGLLSTSYSFTQFLFAPIWGRLSDRIGRRPVLVGSLVLTAVSYVIFAFATSLAVLFAARILAGLASAVISVAQSYIADSTRPQERTKGMGILGAAFGMGFIFGPAIGGILSRYGYAIPGFFSAGLALVAAVLAVTVLPESRPAAARNKAKHEAAARLLRPRGGAIVDALRRPVVGPALMIFFVATTCFSGMEATIALIGQRRHGIGPREIGYFLALAGVVGALMQVRAIGPLANRFGERALIAAGLPVLALGFAIVASSPMIALFAGGLAIIALANALTAPSLSGLVSLASRAEEQGSVLGIYQSLGSLARSFGPFAGGFLFDHVGTTSPLWVGAAVVTATMLLTLRLPAKGVQLARTTSS